MRLMVFRLRFSMGLLLSKIGGDMVRLPSGRSLREAKLRILEANSFHDFLGKGRSEPGWVGKFMEDNE